MRLTNLSITQAKEKLRKKEISVVELTKSCLDQIEKYNPLLNTFITVCKKEALSQAKQADSFLLSHNKAYELKPLLGIPIAIKDLFSTKDIETTAGSNLLKGYIPPYDATVVKKLKEDGAIIVGKTNLDAWAHGSSGENSDFGATKNPYNTDYVPGGSSSGSSVAVASNMSLAATGTDTGGSIRLPASFCNIVGLKPTYGRVSRYGIIAMASSLDSVGHFTKTVEDSALILSVTAGNDPLDATTPPVAVPDYKESLKKGVEGLTIGIPKEYFIQGLDPKIKEAVGKTIKQLEKEGAEIVEISLPHTEYANVCYYIIMAAEVSSNLARYDGIRYGKYRITFGEEAKRRIMLGSYVLSAGYYDEYYKKAMQIRTLLKKDFENAFQKVDVIITPLSPTPPWKIGEKVDDPLKMYLSDVFTVTANLVGIPGLSIPIDFVSGLPTGIQLLGQQFSESLLFQVGSVIEQFSKITEKDKL